MDLGMEIATLACELSGKTKPLYTRLSQTVAELLLAQVPKKIPVSQCQGAIVAAGAFLLLSYVQTLDENELSSFDVGTLKLDFRDRSDSYAQIARQIMQPWSHDETAFCGVRA